MPDSTFIPLTIEELRGEATPELLEKVYLAISDTPLLRAIEQIMAESASVPSEVLINQESAA